MVNLQSSIKSHPEFLGTAEGRQEWKNISPEFGESDKGDDFVRCSDEYLELLLQAPASLRWELAQGAKWAPSDAMREWWAQ
jgi:hypothetical protein